MKKFINFRTATISMWAMFIVFIAVLVLCSTSCTASTVENKPPIQKSHTIEFDFEMVDDIFYSDDDNAYYIEYDDPDAFDYENLAYLTNREEWYGPFIIIDIEDSLIDQFLNDYDKWRDASWEIGQSLSDKYTIQETWIVYADDSQDVLFTIKEK